MPEDVGFTVIVTFRALPETAGEVLTEITRNARDSLSEPGCLEFTVLQDTEDKLEFLLYERYRDERAFRSEHMATGHYARWKSVAARCVAEGSQHRREFWPAGRETP